MIGHPTPRRKAVWSQLLPSGQRQHSHSTLLLTLLLMAVLLAASLAVAGCGSGTETNTSSETTAAPGNTDTTQPVTSVFPVTVVDDSGNTVTIPAEPKRIVSTAPANTETLFALGVGDRVVGVTSLDDYPPEVADIAKIGDYTANTEAITALSPDLVVGYSGNEEALAPLQAAGVPVLIMNPTDLEGVYSDITTIGAATGITGVTGRAATLVQAIKAQIAQIGDAAGATGESPSVFYALDNTLWTCGPGSFVDELLTLAHATNVASVDAPGADAYYQFSPEQLVAADPDFILLPGSVYTSASEFTADPRFAGLKAVTEGNVFVIDDVVVTRPGPRIGDGLLILAKVIHPGAF